LKLNELFQEMYSSVS